jgi:non-homologous end joining protein Ku
VNAILGTSEERKGGANEAKAVWSELSVWSGGVAVGLSTVTEEHEPEFHQFADAAQTVSVNKPIDEHTGDGLSTTTSQGVAWGGCEYVVSEDELDFLSPKNAPQSRQRSSAVFMPLSNPD